MNSLVKDIDRFISLLSESVQEHSFVKFSLGNYQGNEVGLKKILGRLVRIKGTTKFQVTFRYDRRDVVKNLDVEEGIRLVNSYLEHGFLVANLFSTLADYTLESKKGKQQLIQRPPSHVEAGSLEHDRERRRLVKADVERNYLHDLGITDAAGTVYKKSQDKYRQINHYIELLRPLLDDFAPGQLTQVVDMGSGKGYLTFALYDYLKHVLALEDVEVRGVEYRKDLVDLCNQIADKWGFQSLRFQEGSIVDYDADRTDMLVALHACDTATDEAIYQGIRAEARLIVVAPCCHKQIRRELERRQQDNELQALTRFGIFMERQAEMLTDALRALILEYYGYKVNVFEFISDAHTPKNVLIVGAKSVLPPPERNQQILAEINRLKDYFGIRQHHLEGLLGWN